MPQVSAVPSPWSARELNGVSENPLLETGLTAKRSHASDLNQHHARANAPSVCVMMNTIARRVNAHRTWRGEFNKALKLTRSRLMVM
jgi:hypothetical protein